MKAAQTLVVDASAERVRAIAGYPDEVTTQRRAFPFRSAAQLVSEAAPLQWLLKGWFELATFVLFFGDAASCKTWMILAIAVHVAAGLPWYGAPVRQGAVFMIVGEGYRGQRRRIAGIAKHFEIDTDDLPLYVSEAAASFTDRDSIADVITAIQALANSSGHAPVLVVVDTLSRNFGAADENSTSDMAEFVKMADWVRLEFGATVVVLHHVGHADKTRARGNTTLRGALDVEYKIVKDEAGIIDVECTKSKDFESPAPRRYVLKNVPLDWLDEDGNPVNSAAPVPTDSEPVTTGKTGRGKHQTTALRLLREADERHRHNLSSKGFDPDGARITLVEWKDLCAEAGINRFRFREVRKRLENAGLITVDNAFVCFGEGHV